MEENRRKGKRKKREEKRKEKAREGFLGVQYFRSSSVEEQITQAGRQAEESVTFP